MNSGSIKETTTPTDGAASYLPDDWLGQTYGNSQTPTVVVDAGGCIIYINEAARALFGADDPTTIHNIGGEDVSDHTTLSEVLAEGLESHPDPLYWQGLLNASDSQRVSVRLTPLPAPEPVVLCQIRPCQMLTDRTRAQLLSDLSVVRRRNPTVETAGLHVVETLSEHLDTSVTLLWNDEGRNRYSWRAGDEDRCDQMVENRDLTIGDRRAVELAPATGMMIATLKPGESSTAVLLVSTHDGNRPLECPLPFWNSVATTCEATLQTARLMESNRRRHQHLTAVIEQMPMSVVLFDEEGCILDLNRRARALVGRQDWDHVVDQSPPYELYEPDGTVIPREQWPLIRAVKSGQLCDGEEFVLDYGDQHRTVSVTVVPIPDGDEDVRTFMAIGYDVTQRSEQERRRDEFLSVASHELRNPLTPLSGLLHLAIQQAESDEPVDPEVLERSRTQVQRLKRLIEGLLDISRLETGKLPVQRQPTELQQLLDEIMKPWLEGQHGDRIEVNRPHQPIQAQLDPDRIDQVITNVVDNAIKHGCENSRISVGLRVSECGQEVIFRVEDGGDGIPQSIIDRVFDRHFFDSDSSNAGVGLGLYIARQIIEGHDGKITIESGEGEPTRVDIRLPRTG